MRQLLYKLSLVVGCILFWDTV